MTLDFAARTQLGDFSYDARFEAGNEIVVLFGHSGAGKSLTLQLIAGLLRPAEGRIAIGGEAVFDSEADSNLRRRRAASGTSCRTCAVYTCPLAENVAFGENRKGREARL